MIISFFGHSYIFNVQEVRKRLLAFVESKIKRGAKHFLIGTHGDFDQLALSVCKELKQKYEIEICLVFTSLTILKEKGEVAKNLFGDITLVTYDIENTYYKNTITYSNQKMIEESNFVIFYVDETKNRSGAKNSLKYAKKKNKSFENLYKESDSPFYGLTNEEIEKQRKIYLNKDFSWINPSFTPLK